MLVGPAGEGVLLDPLPLCVFRQLPLGVGHGVVVVRHETFLVRAVAVGLGTSTGQEVQGGRLLLNQLLDGPEIE